MTLRCFQVQKGHSAGSVACGMEYKMTWLVQLKYDAKPTKHEIEVKYNTNG